MGVSYDGGVAAGSKAQGTYTTVTWRFIPTFWSSKFIEAFYNQAVYTEISNTDYQGEITSMGDKVIIPLTPSITINDYTIGQTLSYERPNLSTVVLDIDKAKYFAFKATDVEKMQSKPDYVAKFSQDAANQMKQTVDSDVMGAIYDDADAANLGTTAGAKSASINLGSATPAADNDSLYINSSGVDPFVLLSRLATVLDEQNAPETDRWVVVPPLFRLAMQESAKHTALIQNGNEELLRKGYIGQVDRFKVFVSNAVYNATVATDKVWRVVAGHKSSLTFAAQMTKTEQLRNQNDFGDLVRGLMVYGYKTVNPKLMTAASIRFTANA